MNLFGFDIIKVAKKKPQQTDLSDTKVPMLSDNYIGQNMFASETQSFQQYLQQYKSWVYICSNKNAATVAKHPLKLYVKKPTSKSKLLFPTKPVNKFVLDRLKKKSFMKSSMLGNENVEEVLEHPFLDLLTNVNEWSNRFDMWMLTILYLELTGNAYWYIISDGNGIPQQMWVLMSQYMKVITDPNKFIVGYEFKQGLNVTRFDVDEIIHFKYPNPSSNYYGFAPLNAIGLAVKLHGTMQQFELTLLNNNASPEGILSTEQTLGDKEFTRLKEQWNSRYSGFAKAGKTPLLEKGISYQQMGLNQKDMSFPLGRKDLREEIVAAFGVPMSKVTTSDVNLANAEIGEEQYMSDTIGPKLTLIEEKINEKLIGRYDENLFVAYDSISKNDKEFELRTRESNLVHYITTVNEERENQGMDSVEWGDIPLATAGIAPLGSQQQPPAGGEAPVPEEEEQYFDDLEESEIIEELDINKMAEIALKIATRAKELSIIAKNPGHSDQSVHGRRGGGTDSPRKEENKREPIPFTGAYTNPNGASTEHMNSIGTDANGNNIWSKDRTDFQKEVKDKYKEDMFGHATPVEKPVSYMLGGGPASGKSTMEANIPGLPSNMGKVDPDKIKTDYLPEFKEQISKGNVEGAAGFVHEESSYLSKQLAREMIGKNYNTLLDGTGDNDYNNLAKKVTMMSDNGKRPVKAFYATIPTETALEREKIRAAKSKRKVNETFLQNTHRSVSNVFQEVVKNDLFDELSLYDNRGKPGESTLVFSKVKGQKEKIHNQKLWDEFVAKGKVPIIKAIPTSYLTTDIMIRIMREAVCKLPPTDTSEEANSFRKQFVISMKENTKKGWVSDIPFEIEI